MPLEEPFEVKVAKSENHQSNDDHHHHHGDDDNDDDDDDDDHNDTPDDYGNECAAFPYCRCCCFK